MKVNATYLGVRKIGDPNSPTDEHFINVPQCHGHSEKEMGVDASFVDGLKKGDTVTVDTLDLPYKRVIPKGEDAARVQSETLAQAAADSKRALEISNENASKLDQILAKLK